MSDIDERRGVPEGWDRSGLAPWTYLNDELAELEKDTLFRRHWQLACHVSNLPERGSYITFDIVGERAIVMRGDDGEIRAFHNLCRHRGSRVLDKKRGVCKKVMICPFHGWGYNLDGTLRSPTAPESLPKLDKHEHGLKPIELDIWMGFVFLRFLPGNQPKISELLSRHEKEVAPYGTQDMVPVHGGYWQQEMKVNWKAVRDVDNEGYHVPMAHPGLHDLYGKNYYDEPIINGTNRSFGELTDSPSHLWSVRHYKKILPDFPNLSGPNKRAWLYIGVFPNTVISFYPESAAFYQEYPLASGRTLQRGATYRYAEESREMRLSRYLSERIDKLTTEEDTQLIEWTCEAMESSAFDGIILSDREYGVRAYHDKLRDLLPVMSLPDAPAPGTVAATNARMTEEQSVAAE